MTPSPISTPCKAPGPSSTNPKVDIKPSTIHGLGLFAARQIRKGEEIGLYEGRKTTVDGDHVLWIYDENTELEYGIDGQSETRYVNHSRRPNAYFDGEVLEARRKILPGEEITHDYGEAWTEDE